jgi:hypothetical protein
MDKFPKVYSLTHFSPSRQVQQSIFGPYTDRNDKNSHIAGTVPSSAGAVSRCQWNTSPNHLFLRLSSDRRDDEGFCDFLAPGTYEQKGDWQEFPALKTDRREALSIMLPASKPGSYVEVWGYPPISTFGRTSLINNNKGEVHNVFT